MTTTMLSQLEYFGKSLASLGDEVGNLVVLDADVASSTKTSYFAEKFPSRFIQVGISEQDMIGIAAGLASCGKIPVACAFANFLTGRGWEQIANSVARPYWNVKIVGTHAGLSPHADGNSHQSIADIAIMRVLPKMRVVVPADAPEASEALRALVLTRGPAYMRLGRGETPVISQELSRFELGKARIVREGSDATIIANGVMVALAVQAAEILAENNISVKVTDMHTVKPLDKQHIVRAARETGAIATLEEHSIIGGLGSAVSEVLSQNIPTPMRIIGIDDDFAESSRDYWSLLSHQGLTPKRIADTVAELSDQRA